MGQISPVNAAAALMSLLVAALTDAGVQVPAQQGVAPGNSLPWDGEELVINFLGIARAQPGSPGQPQQTALPSQLTIFVYSFHVTLIRADIPTVSGRGTQGGIPPIAASAASFQRQSDDIVALTEAMVAINKAHTLVPNSVPLSYGPINTVGPEGDLVGITMPVEFTAGFAPDGTY